MPKNSHDIRLQRCIDYRKTAEASLNGWIKIMDEEYKLSDHQAKRDFAKAGDIIKTDKEEERKVYLASIEAQLDVIHKEAVDGILKIKQDNQNTKKMSLSFIKQLQDRLNEHPDELTTIVPHLNKLIDSINKSNYNESKVIEIMGKWRGLEAPSTQIQVNTQNNYKLSWGNERDDSSPQLDTTDLG